MKIFIRSYQSPFIGNCSTDVLHIPSNKILVAELKDLLYERYRIHPSQQRLTVKIAGITLVKICLLKFIGNNDK